MHKCKISNLHKIVISFSLFNVGSILANSFFENNSFASNKNNQENSTLRTIYKSSNQTAKIKTNIEYRLLKNSLQRGKKN